MRILISNDDSINARGIAALMEVASEFGEVVVIAPDRPRSGQGHALTLEKPLRLHENKAFQDGFSNVQAYACTGTPVDCIKIGKDIFQRDAPFDLCLSGINHGSNAATNVLYSGTMGAAMEGRLGGIPSIGFSLLGHGPDLDFTAAQQWARTIIKQVLAGDFGKLPLLNVNIPNLPFGEIKGAKMCQQAQGFWHERFVERTDPLGKTYYWLSGQFSCDDTNPLADEVVLREGYVSIVPVGYDMTDYKALATLQ